MAARSPDRYFELKSQIHRKLIGVLNLDRVSSIPKDRVKEPSISDILVNRYNKVYIERNGKLSETTVRFKDDAPLSRLQDGTRKTISISEVLGVRDDRLQMQEIFTFERVGVTDAGKVQGRFRATGISPRILERLRVSGIQVPHHIFEEAVSVNL